MRERFLRNFILLPVLLFSAVFFCGCGRQDDTGDGRTTVTVWAHEGQPTEKQALKKVFESFNTTSKDVRIKFEFKQEQGYGDRVNAAAMAGSLPDIIEIDGPYTANFADAGIIAPLDKIVPEDVVKDFLPTVIRQGTFKGKLYSLGAFESTVVVFCNPAVMKECGIKIPRKVSDTWTWEQFMSALKKIKKKRPDLLPLESFMQWGGEWLPYAFSPLIWSNGGRILSEDGRKCSGFLDAEASVYAMKKWQELFTEKLSDKSATPGQFRNGKAAMAWGVFNRWPLYKKLKVDFIMMPLPKFKVPKSPSGSWCWAVGSGCKNEKAAAKVLLYLLNPAKGIVPVCEANGGIPSREGALKLMKDYSRTRRLFVEQLRKTAQARPSTPDYAAVSKELSRAMEDIARGGDVRKILSRAAKRIDAVIGKK